MCQPASMILTKDKVFWSKKSDHHERIIEEFSLTADGVRGPNIVRVEICPPGNKNLDTPIEQWVYRVDQDILPEWYNSEYEGRVRKELEEWHKTKVFMEGEHRVNEGHVWLFGTASAVLRGSASADLWNKSSAKLYNSSSAMLWNKSSAVLWDKSSADLWDSSSAELRNESSAKLYYSSSAKLWNNSSAVLYESSSAELRNESSARLWNNSSARLYESSSAVLMGSSSAELWGKSSAELYNSSSARLYDSSLVKYYGTGEPPKPRSSNSLVIVYVDEKICEIIRNNE